MRSDVVNNTFKATLGHLLAPLKPFMDDDAISEILVNGYDEIFVEQGGRLVKQDASFESAAHLEAACRNLTQYVHKTFRREGCRIDGRLPDGSRIHILHDPASSFGTLLSIRRFGKKTLTLDDLIGFGSMSEEAAEYLRIVVELEKNMVKVNMN